MDKRAVRQLNHVLGGLEPRASACVFLFTPNDGSGQPALIVQQRRLDPHTRLHLIRQGAHAMIEGRVRKLDDGSLQFRSNDLTAQRLKKMVSALEADIPYLSNASLRSGAP